ncbi:unnamed protein product [Gongylonema pulchrum]|uniref:Uncharacterized protein n=1 Tax=Gongylonema pulchrum TaxID=637853 RepID=A0A183CUT1_9BILA|nr:unnamed protein product [Gongylonema pulchrum]
MYKLEKRCSLETEQEEAKLGEASRRRIICKASHDGIQAYCLCLDNYCNKESLLKQAEKEAKTSGDAKDSLNDSLFTGNGESITSAAVQRSSATSLQVLVKPEATSRATSTTPPQKRPSITSTRNILSARASERFQIQMSRTIVQRVR